MVKPNQCFGSWHSGICNFVLADGTVRSISVNMSIEALTLLGLPSDGQPVKLD